MANTIAPNFMNKRYFIMVILTIRINAQTIDKMLHANMLKKQET